MTHYPVVIIGAGPAGLTAAYELTSRGVQSLVLEQSNQVGGIARTELYKGYRIDIGGHRFYTKVGRVQQLWQELLGDRFISVPRLSRIYYRGKFFDYPLAIPNTLGNLGILPSCLIVLSYLKANLNVWLRLVPDPETFEDFVTHRFGKYLYKTFFKTYTEKVWGIPCHKIQADWAEQRIQGMSLRKAVLNALFGSNTAKSLIKEFQYPVLGPGLMWESFQAAIAARGSQTHLNTGVVSLKRDRYRILNVVVEQAGKQVEIKADQFISSMPITALIQRLDPPAPPEVKAAAQSLSYRAFLIVALIVDSPDLFPDNWIYVHSPHVKVGRIQNFKNWSAAMVPDPSKTCLGMEYFCDEGDEIWRLSESELISLATQEIAQLGLAQAAQVEDGTVIRQPKAYPVYDRDYREHLQVIQDYLGQFENLYTIGRNGMHRYNNQDHSMLTAILAVENLFGAGHDLWTVNTERSYQEEFTKEEWQERRHESPVQSSSAPSGVPVPTAPTILQRYQQLIAAGTHRFVQLKNRHFLFIDAALFLLTPFLALLLLLGSVENIELFLPGVAVATVLLLTIKVVVYWSCGFYRRYWRFASIEELMQLAGLTLGATMLGMLGYPVLNWLFQLPTIPRFLPLIDGLLSFFLVGALRFSVRALGSREHVQPLLDVGDKQERVLVVGAGSAGVSLVHEMQRNPQLQLQPVAFVDDDPAKRALRIGRLSVLGDRHAIPHLIHSLNIHRVVIAIPSAPGKAIREILEICQSVDIITSTLPGLHEILNGRVRLDSIRDICIEDLLRRDPIQTDIQRVSEFIRGKRVLVTGAGGSIGSELCRQILICQPAEIILLGHGENSIFDIYHELNRTSQILESDGAFVGSIAPRISSFIADVRFPTRLEHAFQQFKPEIVFHAAAHKHVPLMELNPPEAITNNVLGTQNMLELAEKYQVNHFVMISTDKAVNPTSVMGATKRLAEMLVLRAAQRSGRPYVVVRFGNVLGSRGSVIPTFRKQISVGGPVTVTHPDMTRYFMTIPEAVQLVLQACVISSGGEVLMLNMGQAVRIMDLAADLIRLSGYEVHQDIEIEFTGLRPGEKLCEELFIPGEEYESTEHENLVVVKNASRIVPETLDALHGLLLQAAEANHGAKIIRLLEQMVPGYLSTSKNSSGPWAPIDFPQHHLPSATSPQAHQGLNGTSSSAGPQLKRSELIESLAIALSRQELRLYYQPIISLQHDRVVGFEALLRWKHPKHGLLSPDQFMPVAEATGLIIPIGWWVLQEVSQTILAWQAFVPPDFQMTVSINLSAKQFLQKNLIQQIQTKIPGWSLVAKHLQIDLPESVLRDNFEVAQNLLPQLRTLGFTLQVDNFGLQESPVSFGEDLSLTSIEQQFHSLKIDPFLIGRLSYDAESRALIESIAVRAHQSGLNVIATGIETSEQLSKLKDLNCRYGQGFFFSKPIDRNAARELLSSQASRL